MRTLTNPLAYMNGIEIFRQFEKYTMRPTTLYSFWKYYGGRFARLICNHSDDDAHFLIYMGPIELVTQ
jgi:hypothetical protein